MKRSAGPAKQFNKRGGVAQLGERTVRIRKVKGSNPSVSTTATKSESFSDRRRVRICLLLGLVNAIERTRDADSVE